MREATEQLVADTYADISGDCQFRLLAASCTALMPLPSYQYPGSVSASSHIDARAVMSALDLAGRLGTERTASPFQNRGTWRFRVIDSDCPLYDDFVWYCGICNGDNCQQRHFGEQSHSLRSRRRRKLTCSRQRTTSCFSCGSSPRIA